MLSGPDFTDPDNIAARSITYNADNLPVHIEHTKNSGTVISDFVYDGEGRRVKKTVGSSSTYYIGDYFETDGMDVKYIFGNGERIAKVISGETYYYHKDHLGSTVAVTDRYGTVISSETSEYMPFGEFRAPAEPAITNYLFTDQEYDPETGLYFYGARYYDPAIGRFISPDSIIPDPYDPQSLDRYSYVRNNPLKYVDPSGHYWAPTYGGHENLIGPSMEIYADRDDLYYSIAEGRDFITYSEAGIMESYYDVSVPYAFGYNDSSSYVGDNYGTSFDSSRFPLSGSTVAYLVGGGSAIGIGISTYNPYLIGGGIPLLAEGFTRGAAELLGGDTSTIPSWWYISYDIGKGILDAYPKDTRND